MSTFAENKIDIATKTMVKEVKEKVIIAQNANKEIVEYPYGLLVWFVPDSSLIPSTRSDSQFPSSGPLETLLGLLRAT